MRRRNKIMMVITAFVIAVTSVFYFMSNTKVEAASDVLDVTFKIYDKGAYDDYVEAADFWSGWDVDFDKWCRLADPYAATSDMDGDGLITLKDYDLLIESGDISSYLDAFTNEASANTAWNKTGRGGITASKGSSSVSAYAYYENKYPNQILGADYTGSLPLPEISETTEFNAGADVVVLVYSQLNNCYSAVINIDPTFENASAKKLIKADNPVNSLTRITGYFESETPAKTNGTYGGKSYFQVGGSYNDTNAYTNDTVLLGGFSFTIDSDAAGGDYPINVVGHQSMQWAKNYDTSGNAVVKYSDSPSSFNINQANKKITVAGSSAANLNGVTVGSNGKLKKYDDPSTPGDDPITISGNDYELWVPDYDPADSAKQFQYATDGQNNVSLKFDFDGEIDYVKWLLWDTNTGLSGIFTTSNNAEKSGSIYKIPTNIARGSSVYAAVKINSTDGSDPKIYIIQIPKEPYHDAYLTGFSINSLVGTTATTSILDPTFNKETTSYTIKVPEDATGIYFTPTFAESTYYTTAKMGTTDLTSGAQVNVSTGSSFSIVTLAQDGETTKTYSFSFATLSNDNSINISTTGYTVTNTGTIYSVEVPYKTNPTTKISSLNYTVTNNNNAAITIAGSTGNGSLAKTVNIIDNGVSAVTTPISISVTSESGKTQAYTFNVVRTAPNTNSKLDFNNTIIRDNNGTPIVGTWTGSSFTANDKVAYDVTGYTITPLASNDNGNNYQILLGTTTIANGSTTALQSFGAISSTDTPKATTLVVKSEAEGTYQTSFTINVTREAANSDKTYTWSIVGIDDQNNETDITTIFTKTDGSSTDNITNAVTGNVSDLDSKYAKVKIKITPTSEFTKAKFGSTDYTGLDYTLTLNRSGSRGTTPATATITAQDNSSKTISFAIYSQPLSTNASVNYIKVEGINNSTINNADKTMGTDTKLEATFNQDYDDHFKISTLTLAEATKAKAYATTDINEINGTNITAGEFSSLSQWEIGTPVYILVVAQSGARKTYTVEVKEEDRREKDNKIAKIEIYKIDYNRVETKIDTWEINPTSTNSTYPTEIEIPYSIVQLRFVVTLSGSYSTLVKGTDGIINAHAVPGNTAISKNYEFQARAQNEVDGQTYVIPIKRLAANTSNYITDLKVDSTSITPIASNTYAYRVNRTNTRANIELSISTGASFEATAPSNAAAIASPFEINSLIAGTYKAVTINVKSEKDIIDNTTNTNTYTLYLINADGNNDIDNIEILEVDQYGGYLNDITGTPYTYSASVTNIPEIKIAYAAENPYFSVTTTTYPYSQIDGAGAVSVTKNPSTAQSKTVAIKSTSEYGKILSSLGLSVPASEVKTYNFKITRQAASNVATLDELKFNFSNGTNKTYSLSELNVETLEFENLGGSVGVTISYTKTDENAKVTGLTTADSGAKTGSSNESFTIVENGTQIINLLVTAENGTTTKNLKLVFAYSNAVLEANSSVKNITLEGDVVSGNKITNFSPTRYNYSVTLSSNNANAKIFITLDSSKATLKVNGSSWDPSNIYLHPLTAESTTTVTVICYAQNGTDHTDYTIEIITPALDDNYKLSALDERRGGNAKQPFAGFDPDVLDYTIYVDNNISQYILEPTLASEKSSIDSTNASMADPLVLEVGENLAYVRVKSEKGTYQTYKVKVIREPKLTLSDLEVLDGTDNLITYNNNVLYTITDQLDYEKTSVVINATAEDPKASITIAGELSSTLGQGTKEVALVAGTQNTITITVKGYATTAVKTYTVKVTRLKGDDACSIESYTTEDENSISDAMLAGTEISYLLPRNTTTFNPTITIPTTATITMPSVTSLVPGKNVKKVKVVAQNGDSKEYTINVYCASKITEIDNIKLYDSTGDEIEGEDNFGSPYKVVYDKDTLEYTIVIPYKYSSVRIEVTKGDAFQEIYIDGTHDNTKNVVPQAGQTTTYNIYALSEYGYLSNTTGVDAKSDTYKIKIKRNTQKTDPRIETLTITANGNPLSLTPVFDKDVEEYTIENIGDTINAVNITATPYETTTTIDGARTWNLDATTGEGNYIYTLVVTGTAENNAKKTYTIKISRGRLDLDSDNIINYIIVKDSNNSEHLSESYNWVNNNYEASVTVPYGAQQLIFNVGKLSVSPSKIYFSSTKGESLAQQTTTFTSNVDSENYPNVTYKIYAMSQNGVKGQEYTIKVKFVVPSKDAGLKELKLDGATVTGFDPNEIDGVNGTDYTFEVLPVLNYDRTYVTIEAKANDSSSRVVGFGVKTLKVGRNVFPITVTSENGHQITYNVIVIRDSENPYLTNLSVDGHDLLDTNDQGTKFKSNVYNYHVKTLNTTKNINIKTTSPNADYSITITNTKLTDISINGLIRLFESTSELNVGTNIFVITVASSTDTDKYSTYTLEIVRRDEASADTTINSISIKTSSGGLIPAEEFTFDDKISTYELNVDDSTNELDFTVTPLNNGGLIDANGESIDAATVEVVGNKNLKAGENNVFVVVTAGDGVTKRLVQVKVNKAPYEFEIASKELTSLKDDYSKNQLKESYTVSSKTSQLSVSGLNVNSTKDADQPVITLSNDGKLNVGKNEVKLTITAPDGTVTEKTIIVNRENMAFSVDKEAYEYSCSEVSGKEKYYTIDLGDKTATAITDYTKYIKFDTDKNDLQIESLTEITDSTNEVLVKVSTKDGAESEIVHLQLQSTQFTKTGSLFDIIFWIILGITIILLIIILVCVNRDKYGTVSKKRKNE